MKDFAGSSITYYGLARERIMNKYPRLVSVLLILTLISMTGLAIFLISDLVSFASNPDHKGVLVGLDLKGPESGIVSMADGKDKSRNLVVLESDEKQNDGNGTHISQINASLPSSQAAKGVAITGKSSNSSTRNSVDEKTGNSPVKKHHSSSSSSSSSSSPPSAMSAKNSTDMNNQSQEGSSSEDNAANAPAINETAKRPTPTNQSMNNSHGNESEIENATVSSEDLSPVDTVNSRNPEAKPAGIAASLLSDAISGIANPAKDTPITQPATIIQFKTDASFRQKSDQGLNTGNGNSELSSNSGTDRNNEENTDSQVNADSATAVDSSQKSEMTASQNNKAQEAKAKQEAKRNQMAEGMRKKAERSRAKGASN